MTQSLIAFTVLQLASLVILFAFAMLERLRSQTGPFRGKLQGKLRARPPPPRASAQTPHGRVGPAPLPPRLWAHNGRVGDDRTRLLREPQGSTMMLERILL